MEQWSFNASKFPARADNFADELMEQAVRDEPTGKSEIQRAEVIRGQLFEVISWARSQLCWNQIACLFFMRFFTRLLSGETLKASNQTISLHYVQQVLLLGFLLTTEHMINKAMIQNSSFLEIIPAATKLGVLRKYMIKMRVFNFDGSVRSCLSPFTFCATFKLWTTVLFLLQ